MRFIFGGALSHGAYRYHDVLTKLGVKETLGSYYYFKDKAQGYCAHYVTTGSERGAPAKCK